ncbi:MAG: hypothetical protein P8I91_02695 [Phycisphaerales bacterium]|nr:hypothetical protein [Phycisphaerales bacterium]
MNDMNVIYTPLCHPSLRPACPRREANSMNGAFGALASGCAGNAVIIDRLYEPMHQSAASHEHQPICDSDNLPQPRCRSMRFGRTFFDLSADQ